MGLEVLLTEGIIDEVLGQLKSGKEAEVWLVRRADEILAAKIYKEREHRSFKNNAEYKEGRTVRNTRTQRAMTKGSKFGRAAAEEEWKAAEADALFKLHASGARVPKPSMFFEGVLLMEVVIDAEGHPAPRLVDAAIARENAMAMYTDLRAQVVRLLCADLIHGDLSEFNVLLSWDGPTLIDFPQVISAAQNSRAEHFFKRDVDNLRRFFGSLDPAVAQRASDADEIWRAYVRRELSPAFVPSGNRPAPQPQNRNPRQTGRDPKQPNSQQQNRQQQNRQQPGRGQPQSGQQPSGQQPNGQQQGGRQQQGRQDGAQPPNGTKRRDGSRSPREQSLEVKAAGGTGRTPVVSFVPRPGQPAAAQPGSPNQPRRRRRR